MSINASPKRGWIPELDGIRGLAISMVVYEHYVPRAATGWVARAMHPTRALGGSGVALFFVLSGFLIGGMLMDHRGAKNYFRTFYIRRGCRILPVYFLVLALFVVVRRLLAGQAADPWFVELCLRGGMPVWANFTFTQNFVQAFTLHCNPDWLMVNWSLVLEEQFYLLLPLAVWLCPLSRLMWGLLAWVCLHPCLQLYLCIFHPVSYYHANGVYPTCADALLVGVLCAHGVRQEGMRAWLAAHRGRLKGAFGALLAGAAVILVIHDKSSLEYEKILVFDLWLSAFFGSLLLLVVTDNTSAAAAVMRWPLLRRLGLISYTVYLIHPAVDGLMHGLILGRDFRFHEFSDVAMTVAAFGATLILATLSWHFLEKPIVRWGHSWSYEDKPGAAL